MLFKRVKQFWESLTTHPGFLKYFKNTSWLFIERIIRIFSGLIIGVLVVRYLGPEQFGLLSYAQSIVALFTILTTLGLDSIVIKELVKKNNSSYEIIGTTFWIKTFGGLLMFLLLLGFVLLNKQPLSENILILIIGASYLLNGFNVIDFYFQSKVLSKYVVISNIVTLIISSTIKIYLLINNESLYHFASLIVLESILLAIGLAYFYLTKEKFTIKWTFNKSIAKSLIKQSWPLLLSGALVTLYMRVDQVMVKAMINENAVGQYSAALKLSEAWYFIPTLIVSSLFPSIVNIRNLDYKKYFDRLQKLFDLLVWIGVFMALGTTFFSEEIVNLLYGEQYLKSTEILKIHIWTGVFVAIGVASGKFLLIENLQIISFWRTFYGAILNLVLNLLLIKKIGVVGAAISTLFTYIFVAFIFDFFDIRTRKIFFMKLNSFNVLRVFKMFKYDKENF